MQKYLFMTMYLLCNLSWVWGQQINGVIYYQNSGGQTAEGVQVSAFGCSSIYSTSNGLFQLDCPNKKAGERLKLIIGNTNGEGEAIEVVNNHQLEWLRIPEKENHIPIDIIICYLGQRNEAAMRYYDILVNTSNKAYERRLSELEAQLANKNLEAQTRAALLSQIDQLRAERDAALEKLEEQAQFIASINQDQASDLVKEAILKIETGKDIEEALVILDDAKLEAAYKSALVRKQKAKEQEQKAAKEIRKVVEGYELKISLLMTQFKYGEVTQYYERIIEIQEENGAGEEELALLYTKAALVIADDGKYEKALKFNEKSLELYEAIFDPQHPDIAQSYNNIACTYQSLGQYNATLQWHEKAIKINEAILDPQHPDLATSYNNIACTYQSLGQYNTALQWHEKAIKINEAILDPQHPDLATSYSGIALTYEYLGKYDTALQWNQKAIKINEAILDPKHPHLATSYHNMAIIYESLGKYDTALQWNQKAIKIRQTILNPKHPDLATSYHNMAIIYESLGKYDTALQWHEKAIKINEAILDPKHPDLANSYHNMAVIYESLGKYDTALQWNQKSIKINEAILDPQHPDLATSYNNIAGTYQSLGKYDTALQWHEKAIKIRQNILDPKHPNLANSYHNIALTYTYLGQYDTALQWHEKAIAILDPQHPHLAQSYNNIATTYQSLGKYDIALQWNQKSLKIRQIILDPQHPDIAESYNNIALSYKSLGEYDSAFIFQNKSLNILKKVLPKNHPTLKIVYNNWLDIYFSKAKDAFIKKEYTTALQDFKKLMNHMDNSTTWTYIGLCHYYLSNYPHAIKAYYKALNLNPKLKETFFYNNIGTAYTKNHQFPEAHSAFTAYEKRYPKKGRSFRNWAMYYALQGDKEKALANLQKAVELGYKDVEWIKTDSSMDALRGEEVYLELVRGLELEAEEGKEK